MQKFTNLFINGIIVLLLVCCATVEDVQRATNLIRTDNELTRLLVEVRPSDQVAAATYLTGLANHAEGEADALKDNQGKIPDAIAYYRIASTAYWRSGNLNVVNKLFEAANKGIDLCAKLGENAPDRDCLFLRLVIPFAGLESNANGKGLSGLLDRVDFNDRNAIPDEIKTMGEIRESLIQAKPLVEKIFVVGEDDRLLSHPGMREYYCDNAIKAFGYYDSTAGVFETKVMEFHDNFIDNTPSLGITLDAASKIRKLKKNVPSFCQ
jgi:hypothetical protein